MSIPEPLSCLAGIKTKRLTKTETLLVEIEIFYRLYLGLMDAFTAQHKNYYRLLKYDSERECDMLEENLVRSMVNDILASGEYSLEGIAYYTQMPEEVIYEIAIGQNISPSLMLSRKIIELHRMVRPHLYKAIVQKIKEAE